MFPLEQVLAADGGNMRYSAALSAGMRLLARIALAWCFATGLMPAHAATAPVLLLTIDDAIGPANADYVVRGIARAARDGSQLVILQMDTPGGLDTSMRVIIKAILQSPVPVAAFVAPGGARAASAGTYILYASHIAAMAPGTNLGAATPVQIGSPGISPGQRKPADAGSNGQPGGENGNNRAPDPATTSSGSRKQINDATAYIRGLAQLRGRNIEWAERAVREAVSLPAGEALDMGVIDYIAADVPALLQQLDGKKIKIEGQEKQLTTAGATVIDARPDWRARLLATITTPSIALIMMSIGIYGLMFEFMHPGLGVPGVIGAICLLLALYALQLLPVNYAGLALILLGIAFMAAEAFMPSFGVLGLGGITAFIAGALILIDTEVPGYGIPVALIAAIGVLSALLIAVTVSIALKTRRRAVASGPGILIGSVGEMLTDTPREGWAAIGGETWHVVSDVPLHRKQKICVLARNGLVLKVAPVGNHEKGE